MLQGMMDRLQAAAGADPRQMFRLLQGWVPDDRRPVLHELGSFYARARELGPPEPPLWARDVFRELGNDHMLSPELLLAISYVAVEWDPWGSAHRVGLLGAPDVWIGTPEEELRASLEDLQAGDRAAALRVYRSAERGAELLVQAIQEADDHSRGIERYLLEGHDSSSWADPTEELERVGWCYLILLARSVEEEGLD